MRPSERTFQDSELSAFATRESEPSCSSTDQDIGSGCTPASFICNSSNISLTSCRVSRFRDFPNLPPTLLGSSLLVLGASASAVASGTGPSNRYLHFHGFVNRVLFSNRNVART